MRHLLATAVVLALLVTSGGAVGAQEASPEPGASPTPEQLVAAEELLATATCLGKPATIVAIAGVETIGTPGADVIVGTDGDDIIRGEGGNDRICAGAGADLVEGGDGQDRIDGGPGDDRLDGGAGNDTIDGGKGADELLGGGGRDSLSGSGGDDTIDGGNGKDRCAGGPGHDRLPSCNERRGTRGTLAITKNTTLKGPHKGNIVFIADNVRLDCGGHTITGRGKHDRRIGQGVGIGISRRGTVRDCHVTNFSEGIFSNVSGVVVRHSSADGNGQGFVIAAATRVTLTDNTANGNDTWGFILSQGTKKSRLTGNVANDNRQTGFVVNNSDNNTLRSNRAGGNPTNFSISLSRRNTLIDNRSEEAIHGFNLSDSDNNSFRGNSTVGDRESGFTLNYSSRNTFENNTADDHRQGFTSFAESVDNTFRNNTATNNVVGFSDDSFGGSGIAGSRNTYTDNTCIGNGTPSVSDGLCEDEVEPPPPAEEPAASPDVQAPTASFDESP